MSWWIFDIAPSPHPLGFVGGTASMKRLSLFVAVFGVASTSAQAAPAIDAAAQLRAIPLEKLCRTDGALDLDFGTTDHAISPLHKPGAINRALGADLAPFRDAALNATKYSGRFFSASFSVDLGDEFVENEAQSILADRFEAAGWVFAERSFGDDGPFHDFPPGEDDLLFYSAAGVEAPGSGEGVRLLLSKALGELTVDCEYIPLMKAQVKEALGEMPGGTPRPRFVSSQSAFGFPVEDCDDRSKRDFIMGRMRHGDLFMMMPGADLVDYEGRLADWKIMKLVESGKIDRETLNERILSNLSEADVEQAMRPGIDMLVTLAEDLKKSKAGDEAAACRSIHKMLVKGAAAVKPADGAGGDATTPQWRAVHALLDKEAARLGVAFGN
jgi:hypothetical protein